MRFDVSVIIPTFNEAETIAETLAAVKKLGGQIEIIVVDGGSSDDTVKIAQNCGVRVLESEKNRGLQLHVGAKSANADILWFLHADTAPSAETFRQLKTALETGEAVGGNFTICFDGSSAAAKFITWLYPHLRKIGLIYGDSAIFVRREIYEKAGGFKSLRLFEDLEFINRVKKHGKIVNLPARVVTSSRRFENRSFLLTFAKWSIFQGLYWLGVNPNFLAKRYYPVRRSG